MDNVWDGGDLYENMEEGEDFFNHSNQFSIKGYCTLLMYDKMRVRPISSFNVDFHKT